MSKHLERNIKNIRAMNDGNGVIYKVVICELIDSKSTIKMSNNFQSNKKQILKKISIEREDRLK